MAQSDLAALRRNTLHHRCRIDNSTDLSYIRSRHVRLRCLTPSEHDAAAASRWLAKEMIDGGVG
jgi:hypothetical protein